MDIDSANQIAIGLRTASMSWKAKPSHRAYLNLMEGALACFDRKDARAINYLGSILKGFSSVLASIESRIRNTQATPEQRREERDLRLEGFEIVLGLLESLFTRGNAGKVDRW